MSLTQYLESQEDQDMTRLLNFTRTQEKRREGDFLCPFGMKERGEIGRASCRERDYTFMQDPYGGGGGDSWWRS